MRHDNDLHLLENLGKGKKAKEASLFLKVHHKKYEYYKKSFPKEELPIPSVNEMLQVATYKTQAIFKISSYGKGEQKIAAHMRYISRCGKLELEDQDGHKLKDLKEQRNCIKDWSVDFATNVRSRDTMHLVLSTPPGTNRDDARKAAKDFLETEYKGAGHNYVFVAHDDTEHPHIHAVIKMVSEHGKKLNPRKAYLRQVRKDYAQKCREYGIELDASSRAERGLSGKSTRSEFVQMRKTKRWPKVDIELINRIKDERKSSKNIPHISEHKMLRRNQIIRKRYAEKSQQFYSKTTKSIDKTQQIKYGKAASALEKFAKTMPIERSRGEKLHLQLDSKLGIASNRMKMAASGSEKDRALDQFYAVTIGLKVGNGIYQSPGQLLNEQIFNELTQQSLVESGITKESGVEMELEIDFDE